MVRSLVGHCLIDRGIRADFLLGLDIDWEYPKGKLTCANKYGDRANMVFR